MRSDRPRHAVLLPSPGRGRDLEPQRSEAADALQPARQLDVLHEGDLRVAARGASNAERRTKIAWSPVRDARQARAEVHEPGDHAGTPPRVCRSERRSGRRRPRGRRGRDGRPRPLRTAGACRRGGRGGSRRSPERRPRSSGGRGRGRCDTRRTPGARAATSRASVRRSRRPRRPPRHRGSLGRAPPAGPRGGRPRRERGRRSRASRRGRLSGPGQGAPWPPGSSA